MEKLRPLLVFTACCLFSAGLLGQVLLNGNFQDVPLETAFRKLEKQGRLAVSFDPAAVRSLRTTAVFNQKSPAEAFAILLKDSPFAAQIVQDRYVIIRPRAQEVGPPAAPPVRLCGIVEDAESGEKIPFSTVYSIKTRAVALSDSLGRFELNAAATAVERDTLLIRSLGFLPMKTPARRFAEGKCRAVALRPSERSLVEVVVAERSFEALFLPNKGEPSTRLRPDRGGLAPGFGEPDALRMLQFLPGVRSLADGSGDLRVRGGSPDQNLVSWEGIPLFRPSHLFGQIPAFNPWAVRRADLWKGNAGADRGGRASSFVELTGETDAPPRLSVAAGINRLSGHLGIQAPLFGRRGGLFLSGRRAFLAERPVFRQLFELAALGGADVLRDSLRPFLPTMFSADSLPVREKGAFQDFNGQFFCQPDARNRFGWSFFVSSDGVTLRSDDRQGRYSSRDTVRANAAGSRIFYQRKWGERAALDLALVVSSYRGLVGSVAVAMGDSLLERQANRVSNTVLRGDHRWQAARRLRLQAGFQWESTAVLFKNESRLHHQTLLDERLGEQPTSLAVYGKGHFELSEKLVLEAGGRLTAYENSKTPLLEPRLNLARAVGKDCFLKGSGGVFHQLLQQALVPNSLGLAPEFWLAVGKKTGIDVLQSEQVAAGFSIEKKGWTVDAELFGKRLAPVGGHALRLNGEARPVPNIHGEERSAGLEAIVRKRWGRCSNWVSYTFSRATAQFDSIENGRCFASDDDLRHALNWSQNWRLGAFELAAVGHFRSGLPYSPGLSAGPDVGGVSYGPRNSERLGGLFRWDASAQWSIDRQRFRAMVGLSVFNLFDRKNPAPRRFFLQTNGQLGSREGAGLGRVVNVFAFVRF